MRTAWAAARHAVVRNEAAPRSRWWMPLTLREAFADALRRQWDLARGHRACELHRIEQAAEAERAHLCRSSSAHRRADRGPHAGGHIDSTREMLRTVAAIDAQLASLQVAA